jgi:hypothetical protein
MNTVVSFDWWSKSITVAFVDYNTVHYFDGQRYYRQGRKESYAPRTVHGNGRGIV